ncbi:hypothetical protein LS74_010395 [Helicobacter magdeburgensis]|uniref:Uncharacterized protein n=1 Tax=Helicobacter magdeburgensis TaxID=471858 RepID=A0A4U8SXX9_9HELI|nr:MULTISPECIES: hypothetical protein [Helicobacter]TLD91067.1 hypothetical protein LS74_010395 [Helicobacter magdeburgensis]BDB65712.1 hypothetical protein T36_2191 [Helicobacter cinaedi]
MALPVLIKGAIIAKTAYDTFKEFADNSQEEKNKLQSFDDNGFDDKQANVEQNLQQNENQTEEASKVRRMKHS